MKHIKRIFLFILKITGIITGIIIGFITVYLFFDYTLSRIPVNKYVQSEEDIFIYILTNGVHTDIVVPVKSDIIDWSTLIKFEHTLAGDSSAGLLAFGWGDKGFYLETPTWAELKFTVGFKAVFGLGTSAMHTTFYRYLVEDDECVKIKISNEQYKKLVEYISESFLKDETGNLIHIISDANYGNNDTFYEAIGSYNLFKTCNTWANDALKSCNQKACLWTAFDRGIFYHYNKKLLKGE